MQDNKILEVCGKKFEKKQLEKVNIQSLTNDAFDDYRVVHFKTLKALDRRPVMQRKYLKGYSTSIQKEYISCIESIWLVYSDCLKNSR